MIKLLSFLFTKKLESIQYSACLAINDAMQGTSRKNRELSLESLQSQLLRKLTMFERIYENKSPFNLSRLMPKKYFLMLQEMLLALRLSKLNITFAKNFLSICNHRMEQAR